MQHELLFKSNTNLILKRARHFDYCHVANQRRRKSFCKSLLMVLSGYDSSW